MQDRTRRAQIHTARQPTRNRRARGEGGRKGGGESVTARHRVKRQAASASDAAMQRDHACAYCIAQKTVLALA